MNVTALQRPISLSRGVLYPQERTPAFLFSPLMLALSVRLLFINDTGEAGREEGGCQFITRQDYFQGPINIIRFSRGKGYCQMLNDHGVGGFWHCG